MYQPQQQVVIRSIVDRPIRTVGDIIPAFVPILLGLFQMLLCFAINGLEAGSVYYDAGRGTLYAGFWCSGVFYITWIAMLCYACCKKSNGCGIYLVIQNILNIIFSIILIAFTARFVNNPCLCYSNLCKVPPWDTLFDSNFNPNDYPFFQYKDCTSRTIKRLPILKALLSCAVLMLVSSILFIIIYIVASSLLRRRRTTYIEKEPVVVPPYQPSPVVNPYHQQYSAPSISEPRYYDPVNETTEYMRGAYTPVERRSMKF